MKPTRPSRARSSAAALPPLDWARAASAEDLVEQAMRDAVRRRRQHRRAWATAALAIVMLALGLLWRHPAETAADLSAPPFSAGPARLNLADGSIIESRGETAARVEFSTAERRVVLPAGEAHFQVARDPARPFVVIAGQVEVRAVGTAFSVAVGASAVDVLVTEGRVAVARGAVRDAALLVDAGGSVTVTQAGEVNSRQVGTEERARRLEWRVPTLELNRTPLSTVLPVVNEHASVRLVLADPALGSLLLSGTLRASNVPVLLRILETSYGITSELRGDEVVLRAAR